MRKPAFYILYENKGTDQLSCAVTHTADLRLCFRYIDSTNPLFSKPLAIFWGCTTQFVSDLVENSKNRCRDAAHIILQNLLV